MNLQRVLRGVIGLALFVSFLAGCAQSTPTPYPTVTPYPTYTMVPSATPYPTYTVPPPTPTPYPTYTQPPTATPYPTYTMVPTHTPIPPTDTPMPTDTLVPTNTPVPTDTPLPPTDTPQPTETLAPTDTPTPTDKPTPPETPVPTKVAGMPRDRLAYTVNKGQFQYDIYMINTDGSGKQLLVADASEPSFTKDGQEIIFYDWNGAGVDIMRLDGSNRRRVINDGNATWANIGLDGYTVVYISLDINWQRWQIDSKIYTIGLDGQNQRFITEGDQPAWNPTVMQFVCKTCDGSKCGLFVMNSDGSGRRMITTGANDQNASFSPDGRRIVYTSNDDGNWEIYVMNADGSNKWRLTSNPATDALPAWLSDGQHIAFRSDRGSVWSIYVMHIDGTGLRKITDAMVSTDRWIWEKMAVVPQ